MSNKGRPTSYNDEIAAEILGRIANGEPLSRICKDEGMPVASTVYLWMMKHEDFSNRYARAREDQAETLADEIVQIADETPDLEPVYDRDGNLVEMKLHAAYVSWQKNRLDARKWVAAKLKPKKYGDKIDVTSDGEKVGLAINIDLGKDGQE
jgi:hypothetical protein